MESEELEERQPGTAGDARETRLWPPWEWPSGWFAISASASTVILGFGVFLLMWQSFFDDAGLAPDARAATLLSVVQTTVAALGVLTVGGAAAVAFRRQKTLEAQQAIQREQQKTRESELLLARRSGLHARYQEAASQLSHRDSIIRIAGVHALNALATEWAVFDDGRTQRDQCIDLLCGYLRSSRGIESGADSDQLPSMRRDEQEVRTAVAMVIGQHLRHPTDPERPGDWSDHDFHFENAHFSETPFERAHFSKEATFRGAYFHQGTNFKDARFLKIAWFDHCHFIGFAHFSESRFSEAAWFTDAHFDNYTDFSLSCFEDGGLFQGSHFPYMANLQLVEGKTRYLGAQLRWLRDPEIADRFGFLEMPDDTACQECAQRISADQSESEQPLPPGYWTSTEADGTSVTTFVPPPRRGDADDHRKSPHVGKEV